MGGLYSAIIIGKCNSWVWRPAKCLLHTHVHRWAETPVGREREREIEKGGGGREAFNRLIDRRLQMNIGVSRAWPKYYNSVAYM